METVEVAKSPQEELGGGGGPADSVVLHPYVYPHIILKTAVLNKGKSLKKQLDPLIVKGDRGLEKEAAAYTGSLEAARGALNTALESASVSDQAMNDAAAMYLGLLLGLVSSIDSNGGEIGAAAANTATSPDKALSAAEQGSSASSPLAAPASKLRTAVCFEWNDVVLASPPGSPPRTVAHSDALFELASVLVAMAVRLMHAAAAACLDSATGVTTPASTRGYQLLRQAAGMLDFVAQQVLPALPACLSLDTDLQLVQALSRLALADAQQLTMLRAVAKGNQPVLIASLAADTASQYSQACSQLTSSVVAETRGCKLWQYGQYKQAYCEAYAHCFNGIALWKGQDKCGAGLKSLEAAAVALAAAKQASSSYDAASPVSLNLHHRRVDEDLDSIVYNSQRRMKKENDSVYLQPVPVNVPVLPEGKCLVSALPYALPQPAAAVKDGVVERGFMAGPSPTQAPTPVTMHSETATAASAVVGTAAGTGAAEQGGKGDKEQPCCRIIVLIICFPILAVLWLLGTIIWVILLPLKCCCPCCGFPLQWAADLVLWLMRAPARGLMWATGKKEEEKEEGSQEKKN